MRITQSMLARVLVGQIGRANQRIGALNTMIATGRRVLKPSDDPGGTRTILSSRGRETAIDAYRGSISTANATLSVMEGALASADDLVVRARELALEGLNASTDPTQRITLADEMQSLRASLLVVANSSIEGRYIFGGGDSTDAPYAEESGGVVYRGNDRSRSMRADDLETVRVTLSGRQLFAVHPATLSGGVDLNPAVIADTPLEDLRAGMGVIPGSIQVTDSNGAVAVIDLGSARDVGDVLALINAAPLSITASIRSDGSGIQMQDLGGGTTITVEEAGGGAMASQLGLLGSGAGLIAGEDLDPRLAAWNPLSILDGGRGIPAGSVNISNSTGDDIRSATIDLSGVTTVAELIHAVEHAEADQQGLLGLGMGFSDDGRSLELASTLPHSTLEVHDMSGNRLFSSLGLDGRSEAQDLFNLLDSLAEELRRGEGDPEGRLTELTGRLDVALERVLSARGDLGVRMQHLERIGTRLRTEADQVAGILDSVEGTDLPAAIADLALAETQYQATLATGSRLIRQSLLDYLG